MMATDLRQCAERIRKATERFAGQFLQWIQVVHPELRRAQDAYATQGSHDSEFLEWCENQFGWKRSRVYQLLDAGAILLALTSTIVEVNRLPANESQCRELVCVPDDVLVRVWKAILKAAGDQPITAKLIHEHTAEYRPEREEKPIDKQWDTMRNRIRKWAERIGAETPLAYLEDLIDELRERYPE